MAAHSLRITARFALVLVVVVPALLAVGFAGLRGAQSGRDAANSLYKDHLVTTQNIAALDIALEDAHRSCLEALLANNLIERKRLISGVISQISPTVELQLSGLVSRSSDDPTERGLAQRIVAGWADFQQLLAAGDLLTDTAAGRAAASARTSALFNRTTTAAKSLIRIQGRQSAQAHQAALAAYHSSIELMLIAAALGLACAIAVVAWLIRSVLPRTLAYSAFAGEVSEGSYTRRMKPTGDDELAGLGRVLDDLAQRRQDEDTYDHNQRELLESLQLTETEQEARGLLKRHLQRSVGNSEITVLNRNNSADRLQAATPLDPSSPLIAGLEAAQPRSCLAIRKARPHDATDAADALLACGVCSGCPGLTTCTPLIVGGEVIGSVLANSRRPAERRRATIDSGSSHSSGTGHRQPAQPRHCRTSGRDRRPHRPAQPTLDPRHDPAHGRALRPNLHAPRRVDVRHRPLQTRQRPLRPRARRRCPRGGRSGTDRRDPGKRLRGSLRGRGIPGVASRHRRRGRVPHCREACEAMFRRSGFPESTTPSR